MDVAADRSGIERLCPLSCSGGSGRDRSSHDGETLPGWYGEARTVAYLAESHHKGVKSPELSIINVARHYSLIIF